MNTKEHIQRAAISFTALHNVLESINPEYFKAGNSEHLEIEVFQGLVILGYWKKIVFLLEKNESLSLTFIFNDLKNYLKVSKPDLNENLILESIMDQTESSSNFLLDFIVVLELLMNRKILGFNRRSDLYTQKISDKIIRNEKIFDDLSEILGIVEKVFKLRDLESTDDWKKGLDAVFALAVILERINEKSLFWEMVEVSDLVFEKFLLECNYLVKFISLNDELIGNWVFIRHCILAPAGIRIIPQSKITSILPLHTHSLVHISSPLISSLNPSTLLPADLEGQSYLIPNHEVSKIFKSRLQSILQNLTESRKQKLITIPEKLNLIGEVWLIDFIFNEKPFSLSNYAKSTTSNILELKEKYKITKEKLNELEEESFNDHNFKDGFLVNNEKNIKSLKSQIKLIEKEIENSKVNERFCFIQSVLSFSRFYLKNDLKLTASARQALLTYAQVFVKVVEDEDSEEERDEKIWMAFEMLRVSDQMIYFIEMMRCRNRCFIKNGKKCYKFSDVFRNSIILADISVYLNLGCFDSLTESILDLIETLELKIPIKLFFIQLATISCSYSISTQVQLPESLKNFSIPQISVTTSTTKLILQLLKKLCSYYSDFSSIGVSDTLKENYLDLLSDCLTVIITQIKKDNQVLDLVKKLKNSSNFFTGKSLIPNHVLFKILEEFPNIKTKLEYDIIEINHKEYPEDLLEKAWIIENKTIMIHQKIVNKLRIARKKKKTGKKLIFGIKDVSRYTGEVSRALKEFMNELIFCIYKVKISKSFDFHFLIEQIFSTSKLIAFNGCLDLTLEQVRNKSKELEKWKSDVQVPSAVKKGKLTKRWNAKWKARK